MNALLEELQEKLNKLDENSFRFYHNYQKYRYDLEQCIKLLEETKND